MNSSRKLKKYCLPTHSNTRLNNNFLDIPSKALSIKRKSSKSDCVKIIIIFLKNIKRVKTQATGSDEIFANHTSYKAFVSRIYTKRLKLHNFEIIALEGMATHYSILA